ncbi:hypothetical protein [Billgrantia ethanolica]|uniref:Lipoprotein n=1 Tax=Billgrantia ethanolica TaxID=2733486 RepID=A0ABS9A9F3_9GAMM|nr:hypothetical protein [Halomonas ethanolica]MCE8005316.1 hypothetical protein [Halomonas ethanolica]
MARTNTSHISRAATNNLRTWTPEGMMTLHKLRALVGAGVVAVAISGCTTSDHLYSQGRCLTCVNNPITGEPINYEPQREPSAQVAVAENQGGTRATARDGSRGRFGIETDLDVDLVYARLRQEFGFRSHDDFNPGYRQHRLAMMDSAWHFNATPGTFYELSDYTDQSLGGVQHSIVLKAKIQRSGGGSHVIFEFAPSGNDRFSSDLMAAALRQRAEAVLR